VLQQQLPVNILNNLENQNHKSIYSLQFLGTSAQETVVQAAIKQFDVSLNILFANMTEINGSVIGQMFIQLLGDADNIRQTIEFFERNGVKVEQSGVRV
ncbi:NIL domain-containing protein, partial [Acinetobacter bereziniae]